MASALIVAVATQGEVGLVRKGSQKIKRASGFGLFHLRAKAALERGPESVVAAFLRLQAFFHQIKAW